MIITQTPRDVSTSGVMSVHKATIQNSAKMFEAFSTKVYSDQILAIVRELTSNAIDAHNMSGNPNPIDVYLPDMFDPYFRVKDQGLGMSHAFVTGPFMCLGDGSTKDSTDTAIGGHGIGSKSPLGYTDQMTLRSVFNGTCSIYSVFKDEIGIPCVGLLEQTTTNEVNGVEFSIPVEAEDFAKFVLAAQQALPYFLPQVRVHPAVVEAPSFVQRGATWAVRSKNGQGTPKAIVGGVAYPINAYQMGSDLRTDDRLGPLLEMPLDLFMPIGSVSIPLSREALLYDDKTKSAIKNMLADIIEEIVADIPTMFDTLPGLWGATKALSEYLGDDENQPRSRLVLKHSLYKGDVLKLHFTPNIVGFEKTWSIPARRNDSYRSRRNSGPTECPSPKWEHSPTFLRPSLYHTVIVDDLPPTSKSATIKRVKAFVDNDLVREDQVLFIRPHDCTDIAPALAAFGNLQPGDYILSSSLPEPEKVRYAAGKTGKVERPKVRMFQLSYKGLRERVCNLHPSRHGSPVDEIEYAVQPLTGVLFVMDNFDIPRDFWKKFFLFQQEEIYFVNKSDAHKLKNFELFEEAFQTRLNNKLAAIPTFAQSCALRLTKLEPLIKAIENNPTLFENVSKSKPLGKLKTLVDTYVVENNYSLASFVTPTLPPHVDADVLFKNINDKHWQFMTLFNILERSYFPDNSPVHKLLKELV